MKTGPTDTELLRFDGTLTHDPAIDRWFRARPGEFTDIASRYFETMRACGDEVREALHDGCPNACFGNVPFAYVNVFRAHANIGFFLGAWLHDPAGLLEGTGKRMRHVKLRSNHADSDVALRTLIRAAYIDIKERVERC